MKDATPNAGFTLVELMVTLAVAAILMTAAVPAYQSVVSNNRLAKSSNEFKAFLMTARTEAIRMRRNVQITPDDSDDWCQGADAVMVVDGANDIRAVLNACRGGAVMTADLGGSSLGGLTFTPRGFLNPAPAANFCFALVSGSNERRYHVNAVGELSPVPPDRWAEQCL